MFVNLSGGKVMIKSNFLLVEGYIVEYLSKI
jgi:hypothetical protein